MPTLSDNLKTAAENAALEMAQSRVCDTPEQQAARCELLSCILELFEKGGIDALENGGPLPFEETVRGIT